MLTTAFYDARSYDRKSLGKGEGTYPVLWRFHDFRLSTETVSTTRGTEAVCIFVNDRVDRPCIEDLSGQVLQDDELSRLLIFPMCSSRHIRPSSRRRRSPRSLG